MKRTTLAAVAALALSHAAFAQTFKARDLQVLGNATIATPTAFTAASLRAAFGAQPIFYADYVLGTDWAGCGTGQGAQACKNPQTAADNIAKYYDLKGQIPIIKLASGQTFPTGFNFQQGTTVTPATVGGRQLMVDMNSATINTTDNSAIYIRHYPIWFELYSSTGQGTLTVSGTKGQLFDVRGGGAFVQLRGHLNFGAVPAGYPQLGASRGGIIATCPQNVCIESTSYNITGQGDTFGLANLGGSIQLEGTSFNIVPGLNYPGGFTVADGAGSSTNWSNVTFTGSNVTGPQFRAIKGGLVNTNAQTGSFTAVPGSSYLPGSVPGEMGYAGGVMDNPGTPTATGCGTGATVQNTEPGFTLILGSGLPTSSGTAVNTCKVTMSTRSNWGSCGVVLRNDPGSVPDIGGQWTGPTGSAAGHIDLTWKATGYDPNGKTLWIQCR